MSRNVLRLALAATTALWLCGAEALPITVLADNFDTDTETLNAPELIKWTVSGGTVDVVGNNTYSILCAGNAGRCVDLDGSTGNAGRITSKQSFSASTGAAYSFDVSATGNQRGTGGSDSFLIGVLDEFGNSITASFSIPAVDEIFDVYSFGFSFLVPTLFQVFIEGVGNDNVGVVIDNVALTCVSGCDVVGVPEPASLGLAGLAMLGLVAARSQRRAFC